MFRTIMVAAGALLIVTTAPAFAQVDLQYMLNLPCPKLLTHDWDDPYGNKGDLPTVPLEIMEYVANMDEANRLGSNANIADYILTECRLNERATVGQTIRKVFEDARTYHLPAIPIGGAAGGDAQIQAEWKAYERWLRHEGPQPHYSHHQSRAQGVYDICP